MTTYAEALQLLREKALLKKLEAEVVRLEDSVGRKTVSAVMSPATHPSFDTAAMDGFAIRSIETKSATPDEPARFQIQGVLAAGDRPPLHLKNGVYEIMTGAAFPEAFDACVRQEDIVRSGDSITVTAPVNANQNRRLTGEDFREGHVVVEAGHTIRPEDILCFAALGINEVSVVRKIRVALIATGKELVDHTESLIDTQIRNSTTPYLIEALKLRGVEITLMGAVLDDVEKFLEAIDRAQDYDLVLTTGAISVGRFDFVTEALEKRGLQTYFKKVKIRPGKPLLFGRLGEGAFVIGLPGNPVATATGLRFFVDPFLRAVRRDAPEKPFTARLRRTVRKTEGATCFLKASWQNDVVDAQENQKASITHTLLSSNAWIALDASLPDEVAEDSHVDVYPFVSLA